MSLHAFHAAVTSPAATESNQSSSSAGGQTSQPANIVRINWADEMEKYDDNSPTPADFVFDRSKLPTAPKATLGPDFDTEQVPRQPPFNAHISNVSFEADNEKIRALFKDLQVVSVRLITDESNRPKGYGYVEFADRDSLIGALSKTDLSINNRVIKISLKKKK